MSTQYSPTLKDSVVVVAAMYSSTNCAPYLRQATRQRKRSCPRRACLSVWCFLSWAVDGCGVLPVWQRLMVAGISAAADTHTTVRVVGERMKLHPTVDEYAQIALLADLASVTHASHSTYPLTKSSRQPLNPMSCCSHFSQSVSAARNSGLAWSRSGAGP